MDHLGGGRGRLMRVPFDENICENERIGSGRGGMCQKILYVDPPMIQIWVEGTSDNSCRVLVPMSTPQ